MKTYLTLSIFFLSIFTGCSNVENEQETKADSSIKARENFADTSPIVPGTEKLIFVTTIDRGDYFYIPPYALADSVDAILTQGKLMSKVDPDNRPIDFWWNSDCNDGSYNLTVTPEQIFFSSGHDNPNPNYLYWVVDIKKEQFQAINKGVRKSAPRFFENESAPRNDSLFHDESRYLYFDKHFRNPCSIPEIWDSITERRFAVCCDESVSRQLNSYYKMVNGYLPNDQEKLVLPDLKKIFDGPHKYFSSSKRDIYDWAPHRRPL